MQESIKYIIKDITPPILARYTKNLLAARAKRIAQNAPTEEKGPEWYDTAFEQNDHWRSHYTQSPYYFLWTILAERIKHAGVTSILDIGCGSGQFASFMYDQGIQQYHGFDFSAKRIAHARSTCPGFTFSQEDAFQTNLFTSYKYDTVVCTEFLEHVEGDLTILHRIRRGTRFYGTVPNFPFTSHVRHFKSTAEVELRYRAYFQKLQVDAVLANKLGKTFYIMEGTTV